MNLTKIIKSAGMNLAQVAEKMPARDGGVGISRSAMQQIAVGAPRLETIRQVSRIIGIPANEIVRLLLDEGTPVAGLVESGGRMWRAWSSDDLRRIADEIDALGQEGKEAAL